MSKQPATPESENNAGKRKDVANKATASALPPMEEMDPVARYLMRTQGKLGADHRLDY